ncbi:MAG: aspartate aminotransferase family protein [bacterium]
MKTVIERQQAFEFDVYAKRNVALVRGKNATVWDEDGKPYIDCVCGHGVANLGHCNEHVVQAISEQAKILLTCPNVFYNDKKAALLEKLIQITPENLKRAFLCNSGTEAIEAALKFARFTTGKTEFVCAMRGFHGRTFGAMSATFKLEYRKPYEPVLPGFTFTPFNHFEKLEEKVTDKTAAVLLEIVQGEGGVNIAQGEYLRQAKKLCTDAGCLLIIDEIQTGFCRTGKMFACEHFDLQPDVLCLAKAIAGGVPMGAVVCSDQIEVPVGRHGTTFGGNPLACAAALATIDFMIENKLDVQAKEKGDYFRNKISQHNLTKVREIRNLGLMVGIELREKAQPVILEMLDKGVLVFPAGATVVRVFPPLTIPYPEWQLTIDKLTEVLA